MQELNDVYNIQDTYGTEGNIEVDLNTLSQKHIWKILSIISWLLLISSQLNSLEFNLPLSIIDKYAEVYYSEKSNPHLIMASNFFPQRTFLIISLIGFLIYLIFTIYQEDKNFNSGLFNNFAKFHFLPLFLVSSLYMVSEAFNNQVLAKDQKENFLISFVINCVFSVFGLVLLIIIYVKTKLNCQWYIIFFIKKGVYSSLIMLLWGNILLILNFYNYFYGLIYTETKNIEWYKEELAYISFIIIGLTLASMIAIIVKFKHEIYVS